jgi:hypothetical protein
MAGIVDPDRVNIKFALTLIATKDLLPRGTHTRSLHEDKALAK